MPRDHLLSRRTSVLDAWTLRSNGPLQGPNSLAQVVARALDYRSQATAITMIYRLAGSLALPESHTI